MARPDAIRAGLDAVRARIAAACAAAGRSPEEITLIVITKTYPASDVAELATQGVRDVGENRDQEAAPKAAACAGLDLRWHFVGQLQRNKARSVATYADVVHSVDRARLVPALDAAAERAGRRLRALVQVDLDPVTGPDRGGARPDDVPALADAIAASTWLNLGGVMAVAPLGTDPRLAFDTLAAVAARVRRAHPAAVDISAGMSGDLEPAIEFGATHLRVGSAVLGPRALSG